MFEPETDDRLVPDGRIATGRSMIASSTRLSGPKATVVATAQVITIASQVLSSRLPDSKQLPRRSQHLFRATQARIDR
jgi:hypothetical protein